MLIAQLILFPLLTATGIMVGRRCSGRRCWWVAVAIPMVFIGLVLVANRSLRLHYVPPFAWAVDPDAGPLLMTAAIAVVFSVLIPKLESRQTRVFVSAAMAAMLCYYGVLPAALPLVARRSLTATATVVNRDGICLQQHPYSCGPAAAVTCLRRLGIPEEESALAVAARSAPALGTNGHLLAAAVEKRWPALRSAYRYADSLEEVRVPAVADMFMPRIGGHYVAVLEIGAQTVVVGDPLSGRAEMPREDFLRCWKRGVIEFDAAPAAQRPSEHFRKVVPDMHGVAMQRR